MDSLKTMSIGDAVHQRLHAVVPKSGHIYKGHSFISHFATIPTKYETFVVDNVEKHGFNSTTQRFNYDVDENRCPGVGYYSGVGSQLINDNPSFSRRGTGTFASKSRYNFGVTNADIPAPNSYNVGSIGPKSSFSHSHVSGNFHQKLFLDTGETRTKMPAPNSYNIPPGIGNGKSTNLTSNFKSTTVREIKSVHDSNSKPGPGQYSINKSDQIMNHQPSTLKSVFKSKSKREFFKPLNNPGPTDYNVTQERKYETPEDKLPRHNYLCLAANAMRLPPTPPLPGPGQYNVATRLAESPHFMSSSMFTSNASRWTGAGPNIVCELPGPAQYQPSANKKQSFHYNYNNKWVC